MSIMMGNSRISFLQLTTTKDVVLFIIIIIIIIDEVVKTSNMNDIFTGYVLCCDLSRLGVSCTTSPPTGIMDSLVIKLVNIEGKNNV
jgi:hypothetical protein